MKNNNYEDGEDQFYSINVTCSEGAKIVLMKVLKKIKELGEDGATREIIIEDEDYTFREWYDGDGNSYIDTLECKKL